MSSSQKRAGKIELSAGELGGLNTPGYRRIYISLPRWYVHRNPKKGPYTFEKVSVEKSKSERSDSIMGVMRLLSLLKYFYFFMLSIMLKKLDLGKNAHLLLDEKMFSGVYYQKVFLFFESKKEFSFPLKQISSIRYVKETNPKTKSVIRAIVRILVGIWGFSALEGGLKILPLLAILFGSYRLYLNFKPWLGIRVMVSGGDREFVIIPSNKEKDAKDLVFLANEKISEL